MNLLDTVPETDLGLLLRSSLSSASSLFSPSCISSSAPSIFSPTSTHLLAASSFSLSLLFLYSSPPILYSLFSPPFFFSLAFAYLFLSSCLSVTLFASCYNLIRGLPQELFVKNSVSEFFPISSEFPLKHIESRIFFLLAYARAHIFTSLLQQTFAESLLNFF